MILNVKIDWKFKSPQMEMKERRSKTKLAEEQWKVWENVPVTCRISLINKAER